MVHLEIGLNILIVMLLVEVVSNHETELATVLNHSIMEQNVFSWTDQEVSMKLKRECVTQIHVQVCWHSRLTEFIFNINFHTSLIAN